MQQACVRKAYGEVVWACRPDAGGKLANRLTPVAGDGDKPAGLAGESTYKP